MQTLGQDYRSDFVIWLRSGRWPSQRPLGVERKFNPYHDPRNGQFTFAPGGPRSVPQFNGSAKLSARSVAAIDQVRSGTESAVPSKLELSDAVFRPDESAPKLQLTAGVEAEGETRTENLRSSGNAMTMEEVFPGLSRTAGGPIIAVADDFLGLTSPAQTLTTGLSWDQANAIINEIREIDPNYRFNSLGFPSTRAGQLNQINELRFQRAVSFMRFKDELRPMQVETLRLMQLTANRAYDEGVELMRQGKLNLRLSASEALGNYIDKEVRSALRERYNEYGVDWAGQGPVRVNRNEHDTLEGSHRRPDARVGDVAFDVTLEAKTRGKAQIRGFFASDFKPTYVAIIRPTQLGSSSTYAIPRPENHK